MDIFIIPGNFLAGLLPEVFGIYDIDPGTYKLIAIIGSILAWILLLRIIVRLFKRSGQATGNTSNNGLSIAKSLGWLSMMVSAICSLIAAPTLHAVLFPLLLGIFSQSYNDQIAKGLSFLVVGLVTLTLFFLIQSTLHGFLLKRYINRMSS